MKLISILLSSASVAGVVTWLLVAESASAGPLDSWTAITSPTGSNTLFGITYGNGQFVAVGDSGAIATSLDGVNWVRRQSGIRDGLGAVTFGNGQFVAVGGRETNNTWIAILLSSTNGVDWVQRDTGVDWVPRNTVGAGTWFAIPWGITYGDGQFVVVGERGGYDERRLLILSSPQVMLHRKK
jgi:hypothetical protein